MTQNTGKRVLVGISGGIDSAVAAALLKTQGFEVHGLHMQVWENPEAGSDCLGASCCLIKQADDAKKVCKHLGIPFHLAHLEDEFQSEVIDYVVQDYLQGRTPSPCAKCNSTLKFGALIAKANQLKCDFVATGHYAKAVRSPEGTECYLYRGADRKHDQSYLLFDLKQDQLMRILMPLGDLLKTNVQRMSTTFALPAVDRVPQQPICFINDGGYKKFTRNVTPDRYRPTGSILTQEGKILGRHEGLFQYAIGQCEGYGLSPDAENKDFCVLARDTKNNALIVGPAEALRKKGLVATNCNWIGRQNFTKGIRAKAKLRPEDEPADCLISLLNNQSITVEFDEVQTSIIPGQAIVFYQDELALGGGWVESLTEPITASVRHRSNNVTL